MTTPFEYTPHGNLGPAGPTGKLRNVHVTHTGTVYSERLSKRQALITGAGLDRDKEGMKL